MMQADLSSNIYHKAATHRYTLPTPVNTSLPARSLGVFQLYTSDIAANKARVLLIFHFATRDEMAEISESPAGEKGAFEAKDAQSVSGLTKRLVKVESASASPSEGLERSSSEQPSDDVVYVNGHPVIRNGKLEDK